MTKRKILKVIVIKIERIFKRYLNTRKEKGIFKTKSMVDQLSVHKLWKKRKQFRSFEK